MPSSTSNSDIPYRDIPDRPWPRLLVVALVMLTIGLAGWEALARKMHHVPGSYLDNGSAWAVERRKLDSPEQNVQVVLTGSSRMLWAADLDILEEGLGTRPIQLALPGTSPLIIIEDIVNETDFSGLILVGQTPFLFSAPGGGFMGDVALGAYRTESPSKRLGYQMHRQLSNQLGFLDQAFELFPLMEHYVALPVREGATDLMAGGWKLGDTYDDRQTDMWVPIEQPGSFDHQQIINFWEAGMGDPPPNAEAQAGMAAGSNGRLEPLIAEMRARGGDIVFIRMPSSGRYRDRELEADVDANVWRLHVEGVDALSVNGWDYPQLSTELDIPEWSHLSRESQDHWSRAVVPILKQRYQEFRGENLTSIWAPTQTNEER